MSPAMVEIQTPPLVFLSQNPIKGQILTSPSPSLSDRTAIRSMDPANFPFPPPAAPSGLSKPRLVKVRKHLASPRLARPPPAHDAVPDSGFNPFRSGGGGGPPDRAEDVRDRLYSWNPFVPEAGGAKVSESSARQSFGNVESFGSVSNSNPKFSVPGEVGGNSAFMFASSVKRNSDLSRNSSENSVGASSDGFESFKSGTADFVFGGPSTGNDGLGSTTGGGFASVGEGNGAKGSVNLSWNPTIGLDEGPLSRLSDEIGKLNLQSASSEARRKNVPNEGISNLDEGAFMFGMGVKDGSNLSKSSSLGTDDESFSWLPDELRKLKLQGSSNEGFEKANEDYHWFKVAENSNISFGDSKNAPNEKNLNPDPDVSVFQSGVNNGSNLSRTSSLGSDKGLLSLLPDEMRKLKLQRAGKEEGFQKTKNKSFIFGDSKNLPNSLGSGDTNRLPEETKKLNIGRETSAKNKKDGSVDFSAGVFFAGSNSKASSDSSQTRTTPFTSSDKGTNSDLPDGIRKSDAQGSRNDFVFTNTKDSDFGHKVDMGDNFVFGNSNSSSVSFGETAGKSNMGNRSENLASSADQVIPSDGSTSSEPTPFKFTFQRGKQDYNLSMGPIPQSQTHENIRPSPVVMPSAYPSSPAHSVGTGSTCRSMDEGLEKTRMEFRTQKQDTSCFSNENLSTGLRQSMALSMRGEAKGTKTRKRRGKSRQSAPVAKPFISKENVSPGNPELEPLGDYSPMDYSPYHENLVADQCSRETSVASDDSIHLASRWSSTDSHISASMDGREGNLPVSMDEREEDLVSAAKCIGINDNDLTCGKLDEDRAERNFIAGFSFVDERTSGLAKGSIPSEYKNAGLNNDNRFASVEAETDTLILNTEREAYEGGTFFTFSSNLKDDKSNPTFVASPSKQGTLSASNHSYKRNSRTLSGQDSYNSTMNDNVSLVPPFPNRFPVGSTSVHSDSRQGISGTPFVLKTENESKPEKNRKAESSQESINTDAASVAAQEACEKWRLRGNQAYKNGYLSKAEDYYTRGVNSISLNETSGSCIQALMLCHSNRAATRMSLGRIQEAIIDCKRALRIDPNFLRARVRAANCHLSLGEIEDAQKHFKKCLQSENGVNCDPKIFLEASEGLKKAQQVADFMDQSVELLLKRTKDYATKALQTISEALSISPNSEWLMEMKAEALLMLRKYEEVIQMCEQTLDSAEKNFAITSDNEQLKDADSSENQKISSGRLWRWRLISKSYFFLGKFEEALELLQKHEKVKPIADKFGNKSQESTRSLSVTICKLLQLKVAGNEAFQAGRHLEAVEHYTSALACNTESRSFTAICFCNRAAAYQALGQITDAIADCCLAIALDSSYPKAISRRATLHEMIRDYGHAANDLNRLVSVLENLSEDKDNISGKHTRASSNCSDLKRAHIRLTTVEEESRKGIPLDMYMILGIEPTSSAADVKKAYRKAALRHHPDKAGHFLTRSENVNDGLWREVADEVHADADRLFKMIGEAYAVLSDSSKRLQYDEEEEIRAGIKKGYNWSGAPKTPADGYGSPYDRGVNRRQWRPYGSSHHHWSESSHSNR